MKKQVKKLKKEDLAEVLKGVEYGDVTIYNPNVDFDSELPTDIEIEEIIDLYINSEFDDPVNFSLSDKDRYKEGRRDFFDLLDEEGVRQLILVKKGDIYYVNLDDPRDIEDILIGLICNGNNGCGEAKVSSEISIKKSGFVNL